MLAQVKSVMAISVPQVNKEKIFHIHLLWENFSNVFQIKFYDKALGSALFLFFLIFYQISCACSYEIVLI